MSSTVKSDLLSIKTRLETIETNLAKQSKQIDDRESKWTKMENNMRNYKTTKIEKVYLNVGGVKYTTTVSTLLSDPTSLFNKILTSKEIDLNDEIYIERRGDLFTILLEYFRTGKFNYKLYNKKKLLEIKEEADFFNIEKIYNEIDDLTRDIEIISFEYIGDYIFKGQRAGTQRLEDLKTKDLDTGICCNAPGRITFELKGLCEFESIEVGGWNGNKTLWYPGNGAGAKIYVSKDNVEWEQAGTLSSSFASKIVQIKLKSKFLAKYIKFEHSSFIGFGYLFVKRIELE
jgi:hypothetical protein